MNNTMRHQLKRALLAASLCACLASLTPSPLTSAQQYSGAGAASSLAPSYESELMAVAHHAAAAAASSSSSAASYGSTPHCVLTIKPSVNSSYGGSSASSSYVPQALSGPSSYLSDYSSPRRDAYPAPHGYSSKSGSVCITQQDVDQAIEEAKASLGGYVPKEIYTANSEVPKPMHVTVVAEIITQATRILANRFKLAEPAILYDLPSIDLSKSPAIDKVCPVFLKPGVNCEQTRYRTLTGYCNNLQYQSWGSTRSAMVRFLAPDYYDSISLPRRAYDGSALPSARVVSFVVHQDPPEYDKYHSMLSVVWGQFIDHDMTLAVQATDENASSGSADQVDCCKSEDSHPDCFPIEIPKGDPFYGYFNQKCMHFTRASPGLQPGCSMGPVQAMNKISAFMDGNLVYGPSIKTSQRLRTYHCGQLKSQQVNSASAYGSSSSSSSSSNGPEYPLLEGDHDSNEHQLQQQHPGSGASAEYMLAAGSRQHQAQRQAHGLETAASQHLDGYSVSPYKELLPANKHNPDIGCERRGRAKDVYCFDAGDQRANEQIQLTTVHTTFLREHNRIAKALSYINPYWDDERLFQEARQIVVAQMQHITFNEFLPLVIGKEKIYEYGLELEHPGRYYQGYDPKINAGIRVEFQAAAFRYGHSILPSYIERYNKYHQKIESIRLSKLLKQPYDLYHPGVLDSYLLGLANQRSGRMDPTLTTEVTNHLFEKPGKFFGIDLAAINIQRGRDMGVPGYNHFREYCGLARAKYFEDLTGVFSNKTLLRLSQLYKHVDDIDLWTAGISEYPIQDGLVGPTFACLIARQFVNLRRGDRFWYENSGYPPQFNLEQLDELRKSTAARLICDNSDDIETIQANAMLIADPYTNPRVPCHSLPQVDLGKWKDQQQQQQQYYGPQPAPQQDGAPDSSSSSSSSSSSNNNNSNGYQASGAASAQPEYAHASLEEAELYAAAAAAVKSAGPSIEAYHPAGAAELAGAEYEPLKMTSQFVDHLVEASSYKPEEGSPIYSQKAAAS